MLLMNPQKPYGIEDYAYWEGFLSDDDIRFLTYHKSLQESETAQIGGQENEGIEDLHYRRTNVGWLDFTPENQHIWNKLSEVVAEVNRRFFQINLTGFYEPLQLCEYSASYEGHFGWHMDATHKGTNVPRKLSMVLMLSDPSEYEGGELQVKTSDKDITLEMKQGRAWFFPSYMLHRVTPVTKGLRKTAVLWVGGEPWR